MADANDILAKFRAGQGAAQEKVGWTDQGFNELNSGLQEKAFGLAADSIGAQRGKDANETAGNVVEQVTAPLGHSTAANVLRAGLQTGATMGLNPANLVAPGGPKLLSGTVADAAKQNVAKNIAKQALESGDMSAIKQVMQKSADDLVKIIPRAKPSGLDVLQGNRIPTSARGMKVVGGANEFANPAIKPANMSKVSLRDPMTTMREKVSSDIAKGEMPKFSKGVSTEKQIAATKALEVLKGRLK